MTVPARQAGDVRARDLGIVLLVAVAGLVLAHQGWRQRTPGTFLAPSIVAARGFIIHGRMPVRGSVTPFNSYTPPGDAWVLMPGMLVFSDPRLFDVPGNALIHLGTVLGVFLLAQASFGAPTALWASLMYAVSERGLFLAATHEPRGLPLVYVWMAYCAGQWVTRRDGRYLAAAITIWLVGLSIFMEVAPAVFMLPVVWAAYRPPASMRHLAVGSIIGLLIWAPYLQFEAGRGFADIRSQVLLQKLDGIDNPGVWCAQSFAIRNWGEPPGSENATASGDPATERDATWMRVAGRRLLSAARGLVANFERLTPGAQPVLSALLVAGLLGIWARGTDARATRPGLPGRTTTRYILVAAMCLAAAVLSSPVVVGAAIGTEVRGAAAISSLHVLQVLAAMAAGLVLFRFRIRQLLISFATERPAARCDATVIAIALVVPWTILLVLVEWGRQTDRLIGVWPLQAIVIASFLAPASARLGRSVRALRWGLPAIVVVALMVNPLTESLLGAWHADGWSGHDAAEVTLADLVGADLRAAGRDSAVVGYQLFFEGRPESPWRPVDAIWRDGDRFDILLHYRQGIANLNQCGEDVSARDDYRIVEIQPPEPKATRYVDVPVDGPLRFVAQVGNFRLLRRE